MRYQKGQSGNLHGRPQGSLNKVSLELKEALIQIVENNLVNFQGWIDEIEDTQKKIHVIIKIASLVLPRHKIVDNSFDRLTDEEVNDIIKKLYES